MQPEPVPPVKTAQARYFALYELAPVAYLTLSAEGLVLEANREVCALLGAPREDLAQRPLTGFILGPDQDIFYRYRQQLLKTGEPYACDLRMAGRNGSPFWAHLAVSAAPEGAAGEAPPASRVVLTDISERKRLERDQARFDADPGTRSAGRRLVERLGFSVLEARDGPEALDLFRRHHQDLTLALLDLALPGLDGRVALRAMRELDPGTPLALGSVREAAELDLGAEGLAGVLRKPYRPEALQGLLQRAMALRPG